MWTLKTAPSLEMMSRSARGWLYRIKIASLTAAEGPSFVVGRDFCRCVE